MPYFKTKSTKNNSQKISTAFDPASLVPTEKIIAFAKSRGVDFGPGDPNERIRYFIKLGILPHVTRKAPEKIGNWKLEIGNSGVQPTVGHLPLSVVDKLQQVQALKSKGLTFPQIAEKLAKDEERKTSKEITKNHLPEKPIEVKKSGVILYQKVGLTEEEIKKRLEEYEEKIKEKVHEELANAVVPDELNQDLIPTSEVLKEARKLGVDFGPGDSNERIRYFIKLGILPHAVRKVRFDNPLHLGKIEGHLPKWTIKRLLYIYKLYQRGLSFSQIAAKLKRLPKSSPNKLEAPAPSEPAQISQPPSPPEPSLTSPPPPRAFLTHAKAALAVLLLFIGVTSTVIYIANIKSQNREKLLEQSQRSERLGEVLAATSEKHKLYIDADIEVSGTSLFKENITAPNIIYSVTGGDGIEVTGGQNPIVSLADDALVKSLNSSTGELTIKGSGSTTISTSGSTITISSTDTTGLSSEADTLATVTGRGSTTSTASTFSGGLTVGTGLTFSDTNSTINISNGGTLAFKDGTNTLLTIADQGDYAFLRLSNKSSTGDPSTCAAGDIYFNSTDSTVKACTSTNSWESLDNVSGSINLQQAYDNDTDGSDAIIALTTSDDSLIFRNPATSGTDSGYILKLDQLATGTLDVFQISTAASGGDLVEADFASSTSQAAAISGLDVDFTNLTTDGTNYLYGIHLNDQAGATASTEYGLYVQGTNWDYAIYTDDAAFFGGTVTVSDLACTDCLDFTEFEDTLDLDAFTTINADNGSAQYWLSIVSNLSVGARSTDVLTISQADNTTNNSTEDLLQITQLDQASTGDAIDITYEGGGVPLRITKPDRTTLVLNPSQFILIDNQENGSSAISDGILIQSAGQVITDGFDVSDSDLTNAINVGANNIEGTDATITFTDFQVAAEGFTTIAPDSTGDALTLTLPASTDIQGIVLNSPTDNQSTAGVIDLNITSLTGNNRGIDLAYTFSNTAAATNGYGIYNLTTHSNTTNANTVYGEYSTLVDTVALANTNFGYAFYGNITGDAAVTKNSYGVYSDVLSDNTTTDQGTRNTYGGYFSARGTTRGTTTVYGIYTTASGADTNYGLYVAAGSVNIQDLTASQIVLTDANKNLVSAAATAANTCSDCLIQIPLTTGRNTVTPTANSVVAMTLNGTSGTAATVLNIVQGGNANAQTITSNATTTGTVLDISATALTAGKGISFTGPSAGTAGITGSGAAITSDIGNAGSLLSLTGTVDASSGSATSYGLYESFTVNTTGASNIAYGQYQTISNNAVTGPNTVYGAYTNLSDDDALANTLYGLVSNVNNSSNTATGTHSIFSGYFLSTGKGAGSTTTIGIYGAATGADNNYAAIFPSGNVGVGTSTPSNLLHVEPAGSTVTTDYTTLYVSNAKNASISTVNKYGAQILLPAAATWTGTDSTTTGIYVSNASVADVNYGINIGAMTGAGGVTKYGLYLGSVSGASNNYALMTTGGNISQTLTTSTAEKVLISATTNTGTAGVLDIDVSSATNQNSGLNVAYTSTATTTGVTQYGAYNNFIDTQNLGGTSQTFNFYTTYNLLTKTGTDAHTTAGTTNAYGSAGIASNTSGDTGNLGTKNTYGGYFSAAGSTAGTATTTFGAIAQASGALINYGLYVPAISTAQTANYGIYVAGASGATTSYSLLVDAGDAIFDANVVVGGSTSRTETLLNGGFSLGGDDLFVAGLAGIEGNVYTDGSFIAGASTTISNGSISQSSGETLTIGTTAAALNLSTTTSGDITATTGAGTGLFNVLTGNLKVGNGAPSTITLDGEDAYIEGNLELDGTVVNFANAALTVASCTGCGGGATAWSAITAPTTTLSLSFDIGETTTFTALETTGTFFTYTGTAFTTGEILDITGTFAPADGSTNEAIDINLTHTPTASADIFKGLDLNVTEGANALANTQYGLFVVSDNSANTSTGTHSLYGGYFSAAGKTAGTTTAYGIFATATGADTNYAGVFSGDISATAASGNTTGTNFNFTVPTGLTSGTGFAVTSTSTNTFLTGDVAKISRALTITGDQSANSVGGSLLNLDQTITTSATTDTFNDLGGSVLKITRTYNGGLGIPTAAEGALIDATYRITSNYDFSLTAPLMKFTADVDTTAAIGLQIKTAAGNSYGLTNAIDVSDADITNAISVGANVILGTTANINFDNFDLNGTSGKTDWVMAATGQLTINATSTPNTTTSGVIDLNITNSQDASSGINISITSAAAGTATQYGQYIAYSNATATTTNITNTSYALYLTNSRSGEDTATGHTANVYGLASVASLTQPLGSGTGTRNIYGGYFSASGDTEGTENTFGVYATASGGDNNYAGIFLNGAVGIGTATPTESRLGVSVNTTSGTIVGITQSGVQTSGEILKLTADSAQNASFSVLNISAATLATGNALKITGPTGATAGNTTGVVALTSNFANAGSLVNLTGTFNGIGGATQAYGISQAITNSPGVTAVTNGTYGIYSRVADATTFANKVFGNYQEIAFSNNEAKIGYANYGLVTSSSTTADSLYGGYFKTSATGNSARTTNYGIVAYGQTSSATGDTVFGSYGTSVSTGAVTSGTQNAYGLYGSSLMSGALSGATRNSVGVYALGTGSSAANAASTTSNVYGGMFNAVGENAGASMTGNSYGIHATASGGDNNYNFYGAAISTAGTANYGIYLGTLSGATTSKGIEIGTLSSATSTGITIGALSGNTADTGISIGAITGNGTGTGIDITSLANTGTSNYGLKIGTITGASSGNYGVWTGTMTASATINAQISTGTIDGTSIGSTNYGINVGTITAITANGNSNVGINIGAISGSATSTYGLNIGAISAGTTKYGINIGQITSASSTTSYGINIGGFTSAAGTATVGVNIAASAATATNNYGISIGALTGAGTTNYGIYVGGASSATNNYGIYVAGGESVISVTTTQATERLCGTHTDATAGVSIIRDCGAGQADLAEYYGSDGTMAAGEIVALDPNNQPQEVLDPSNGKNSTKAWVVKSVKTYDPRTIGIVSTNPFTEILSEGLFNKEEHPSPIALAGRVPTKVSTENGPIKAGDMITSSSTAGVGMKATKVGRTIGVALESFEPTDNIQQGSIVVFVEPGWYLGSALADGSLQQEPSTQLSNNSTIQLAELPIDELGRLIREGRLDGQILTAQQIIALVDQRIEELSNKDQPCTPDKVGPCSESTSSALLADSSEASGSAQLAQENEKTLSELNKLLSTTNLSLDTLTVNGNTQLAQTQVAGTFSQDGTLIIDYGRQINVLGSTLYLQNDGLAGESGILVDIGAGAAAFDKDGNLKILGSLTAKNIETEEVTINISNAGSESVGTTSIQAGSTKLTIETTAIRPGARVLITPTGPTGGKVLYVSTKTDYEGFTVAVENGPAKNRIDFDWLIVNSKQISQKY